MEQILQILERLAGSLQSFAPSVVLLCRRGQVLSQILAPDHLKTDFINGKLFINAIFSLPQTFLKVPENFSSAVATDFRQQAFSCQLSAISQSSCLRWRKLGGENRN